MYNIQNTQVYSIVTVLLLVTHCVCLIFAYQNFVK